MSAFDAADIERRRRSVSPAKHYYEKVRHYETDYPEALDHIEKLHRENAELRALLTATRDEARDVGVTVELLARINAALGSGT